MLQDFRYALRQLRKSPGFTMVAVLAIALGIGANTAIFSVVNTVLLRPLPYQDEDRLVTVLHDGDHPVAPANYLDWRDQNHVFEAMGAAESWTVNLSGTERAESVIGIRVTQNLFPLLGVQPLLGRFFLPDEEQKGKDRVVLLSYGLWKRGFGGDPNIVGLSITLQGEKYEVVGVMPKGFQFAPFWETKAELWAPLGLADRATSRGGNSLRTFARLRSGVTLEQARSEIAAITAGLEQQFPGTNRNVTVTPVREKAVGYMRPALFVLLGAVSFVLLIACANVAHMLLARGAARQKEIALRAALGANRWQILRQFLMEGLLIALLGGVAGVGLAVWGVRAMRTFAPTSIPRMELVALDWRVLLFTAAVSIMTGILFGVAPALQASGIEVRDALQESGRGSGDGLGRSRTRGALVASEFALALLLLIGAGLMIRTFVALRAVDPGFNPRHVLSAVISVAGSESAASERRLAFYRQVMERVATLPGVESVSAINHVPLVGDIWGNSFAIEGRPVPAPADSPAAVYRVIFPGYFRTMGLPLIGGRDITEADNLNSPGVVIINDRMAKLYWPGQNPIGQRITLDDPRKEPSWLTVVGVVRDAKQHDWSGVPDPEMYLAFLQSRDYLQSPSSHLEYLSLVVRTNGDPSPLANELKSVVASVDKGVPVSQVITMDDAVENSNAQPRFELWLLGSFAAVALVLAGLGIYGVMSYSVSRRTHELGVRMALGADRSDVVRMVVNQAMKLALSGAVAGLVAALLLARLMNKLLYGVKATDPLTFVGVVLVITAVAAIASYMPARRATAVDPVQALRYE